MFADIAGRYDLLNRIISLGLDRRWRRRLAKAMAPDAGDRFLDLACGTGDQAIELLRIQPGCQVLAADPVTGMLSIARQKQPHLPVLACESETLPFPDACFSGVTITFGIRNFSFLSLGLREVIRVIEPGGRLGILEFARPSSGFLASAAGWYVNTVIPFIGRLLAGSAAYNYLPESIDVFPAPDRIMAKLKNWGLVDVRARSMLAGLVILYLGKKAPLNTD